MSYCLTKFIGIDILAGASSQRSSRHINRFAAVVVKDEEVIERHDAISTRKLIKLCKEHLPKYLGVDNIFEIEPDSARIIRFRSSLPLETRIIQVTGAPPHGFEPLNRVARRYNIPYPSQHAEPLQAAEIIARLAEKNVGYILMPFEEETEIKISRARSIGPGGWSQQRYSRRMRGEILNFTRDIEKNLQDHKIDFDLEVRKTEYGYDNAVFRAYAPLVEIRKIVRPFKGELSRIVISPIRKKRLEFIPASGGAKLSSGPKRRSNRGIIVGVDPGPNTGIAILNFAGKILLVESMRSAARGDIIRKITTYGDPTLIAADVTPAPDFVEKLSKMLNAGLYYPEKLYSSDEKSSYVNEYLEKTRRVVKGAHKRDALFGAIKAHHKYGDIFERIDKSLATPEEMKLRNQVKQLVIKEGKNVAEAIEEIKKQMEKIEPPEIKREKEEKLTEKEKELVEKVDSLKELINRQQTQIDNLEDLNEELQEKNRNIRKENRNLKQKIKKVTNKRNIEIRKDRAIEERDRELKYLRGRVKNLESELGKVKGIISDLKRMIVMSSNRVVVPMKVVHEFSREEIEKTIERVNIEPYDVILLENPSGGGQKTAEMLIGRDVRAVICKENNISDPAMEAFIEADTPVLFDMPIRQIDDIAVTFYDELEEAIGIWEEKREEIQSKKTEEKLGTLIAEYQTKRKLELAQVYEQERRARRKQKEQIQKPRKTIEAKDIDEE